MKKKIQAVALRVLLSVTVMMFAFSCDDDESNEPNSECASLASQIEAKYEELDEIGYNCDKMEDIFNDILELLNQGKSCEELKGLAKDEGYDTVEEYIDYLEQAFKSYMSDCPG